MDHSKSGPIIACATGEDNTSAISVIRISGFKSPLEFQKFFRLKLDSLKARYVYHTQLIHPKDGFLIDDIVLTYFKGPHSYNGENIFEISCHGNPFIIKNIIHLFTEFSDVRYALPGEFTLRALTNKKLTLSQVEGLDLILNSQSSFGINEGLKSLCGELHDAYLDLQKLTLRLQSSIELGIDFIEDVGEEAFLSEKNKSIADLGTFLDNLSIRANSEYSTLLSPDIVLFGPVNAGKSSLFNACLKTNRSIVSGLAGTTRDFISEYINISGNHFKLLDTAGIRTATEEVEKEGIKRSMNLVSSAFYKILVINPMMDDFEKEFLAAKDFDLCILSHSDHPLFSETVHSHLALVSSRPVFKADLSFSGPIEPLISSGPIEPLISSGPIEPKRKSGPIEPKRKSGPIEPRKDSGPIEPRIYHVDSIPLFSLEQLYGDISHKYLKLQEMNPIVLPRHRKMIQDISSKFKEFQVLNDQESDIAIVSNELQLLSQQIQELIGVITESQVLTNIFDNFCIGK